MALHEACMRVQVHTGTRIHWDAHQTFFCTKVRGRGGGGSPSKFFENTDLKNFEKYGRLLIMKMLIWKQSGSILNNTELIAEPIGPFAFIL